MAKTKQSQPKNFEDAVGELEQILSEMERGEVPLEQSLTRYERGNYLLQYCRQVLNKAEQQIEELSKAEPQVPGDIPDDADDAQGDPRD